MGTKGQSTQQQQGTSTYSANPLTQGAGAQALGMAQNAASSPFNLPQAPVAGFTPQQTQAFQQYSDLQGMAQPYYNQAQGLFNQSAAPISGGQVNNYLNPYAGYVLGNLKEQQGQQMNDLTGRATQAAGGVGADRIGVAQGELSRQQGLATGQTLSGIYGSALSAAQQDAQRQQSAAYGIGNLGGAAQNAAIQGTQALYGSGALQQQQNQAQLNAPYQNQLARLAYPYQNAQFLANITGGLAGAMGGTTTSNQYGQSNPAQPSPWSQALGLGVAGLGAYGSAGGFGSNPAYGGGNVLSGDAYGGSGSNPLAGLSPSDYGAGFADGGGVGGGVPDVPEVSGNSNWMSSDPAIPMGRMQPSQVHQPQITPLKLGDSGGGSSGGADIGKIIGTAAQFLPMMLAQGGAAYPPHFADGGFPDDPFGDPNRALGYAALRAGMGTKAPDSILGGEPPPVSRGMSPPPGAVGSPENPYRQPDVKADGSPLVPDVPDSATPDNSTPTSGTHSPYAGISPAAADTASANQQAMQGQTYPVPYDVDHQNDPSRQFARSPWLALLNAGAGMMGGTSPFAGVNIGKGIQQGVGTLESQRKESREEESINQRARQLAMQAQFHADEYTKLKPAEAANIKQRQEQLEESGWQKGAENILSGDVTYFNPRTGESGVLKADGTWNAKGEGTSGAPGGTPNAPAAPNAPPPEPPPSNVPAPYGVKELAPNMEPSPSNIGFMGKGSPMGVAAAVDLRTEIARQSKSAATLPIMKQDLAAMKLSMATLTKDADKDGFFSQLALQPGANFGDRLERAKQANAIKAAAGQPPAFDPEKIAAAENINKIQQRMGLTFASQISPREAFSGQRIGIESSPGLTNSPQGMKRLIAGFEAAADNATDEHAFFQKYLAKNKTSLGWRQDFEAKNPAERYMVNRLVATLPEYNQQHLAEDIQALKKDPSPKNLALFNKHYADTASYFLNGRI